MNRRTTEELTRMILARQTDEIKIADIEKLLEKKDTYSRCVAAQTIARVGGRDAYSRLTELIRGYDEHDILNAAIIAMAQTEIVPGKKDSRFLFPLVNMYNRTGDIDSNTSIDEKRERHQTKSNILLAISKLGDPRAIDFLAQLKETEKADLKGRVDSYIKALSPSQKCSYTFTKADEPDPAVIEKIRQNAASQNKFIIQVKSAKDLDVIPIYLNRILRKTEEHFGPLTYIIDEKEVMHIGIKTEEHVEVARGENVLAAGEVTFEYGPNEARAVEINNSSNGYFPARTSFPVVAEVLDKAGIKHPETFTYLHPRDGFFSDDFLAMFPFHPKYEETYFGRKRKKK